MVSRIPVRASHQTTLRPPSGTSSRFSSNSDSPSSNAAKLPATNDTNFATCSIIVSSQQRHFDEKRCSSTAVLLVSFCWYQLSLGQGQVHSTSAGHLTPKHIYSPGGDYQPLSVIGMQHREACPGSAMIQIQVVKVT
jgi:hypothetical protein